MKKFVLIFAIGFLLVSFSSVFAALIFDDPSLCVAGHWLSVQTLSESAVTVDVPVGTAYGTNGGCTTPAPYPLFQSNPVVERGGGHKMTVVVGDSNLAGFGDLTATYGNDSQTDKGNPNGTYKFKFDLP